MADDSEILLQYFKVRRILNMVSGVCFLVYIMVFPALYFSLSGANPHIDYSYILYAPLSVCLIIQIACAGTILHYRRKALRQIAMAAINFTHTVANSPPGMAYPYQQTRSGQPVYILPPGSFPQFYNSNNAASFPPGAQVEQQQHQPPPSYSQAVVTSEHQNSEPPVAGWMIPSTESSSVGQPHGHSRHETT